MDAEAHPCFALDENDPNYDSAEHNDYELRQTRVGQRTDVIVAYKNAVTAIIEEYFQTHDARRRGERWSEDGAAPVPALLREEARDDVDGQGRS